MRLLHVTVLIIWVTVAQDTCDAADGSCTEGEKPLGARKRKRRKSSQGESQDSDLLAVDTGAAADAGENASTHPSWGWGNGCSMMPLDGNGIPDEHWQKLVDVSVLPDGAGIFVCFNARDAVHHSKSQLSGPQYQDMVVVLVDHFLTDKETAELTKRADNWTRDAPEEDGMRYAYAVGKQYREHFDQAIAERAHVATHPAFEDRFVNRFEGRVASFLRMPASPLESYMHISQQDAPRSPSFHHDKNHALVRRATALLYLNGGKDDELRGGETLFPTLPRPSLTVNVQRSRQQMERARRLDRFASKVIDGLDPASTWPNLQVPRKGKLHRELAALCETASKAPKGEDDEDLPLAIAPVPGRAVFYWHEGLPGDGHSLGGTLLPDAFHAGCPVSQGRKLAIQKFKNFNPNDKECSRLQWCEKTWERTMRANAALSEQR